MIVSADKETRFYKSKNLKKWTYVSAFGKGLGQQPCQYELSLIHISLTL